MACYEAQGGLAGPAGAAAVAVAVAVAVAAVVVAVAAEAAARPWSTVRCKVNGFAAVAVIYE